DRAGLRIHALQRAVRRDPNRAVEVREGAGAVSEADRLVEGRVLVNLPECVVGDYRRPDVSAADCDRADPVPERDRVDNSVDRGSDLADLRAVASPNPKP